MNQIDIPYKLKFLESNTEVAEELINFLNEEEYRKVAFITSKTPNHLITNALELALFDHVDLLKTFQVTSANISFINQLPLSEFDVVIGIGGGKVIDTAKYAAFLNEIPCISIPTSISNDGICSPIAVLQEKHKFKSFGAKIPVALIVPMHLIKKSHEESILSGIGDLFSNLSSISDWLLAGTDTDEYVDDYAVMVSKNAALTVFLQAKNYILMHRPKHDFIKENLKLIVESLALSGIAMEIAGTSRPASGSEHLISHALDELYGSLKPHGIQVAFGTYVSSYIRKFLNLPSEISFEDIRSVFHFLGLPTTLSALGIRKDQLIEAIKYAPKSRPGRYTILDNVTLDEKYLDDLLTRLFTEHNHDLSLKTL